jgi:A nuclease family of the HNH/ENDO VII superfamily with conserved AHH
VSPNNQHARQVDGAEQAMEAVQMAGEPPSLLRRAAAATSAAAGTVLGLLTSTAVGRWLQNHDADAKHGAGDIGASELTRAFGPISAQGRGYESAGTTPATLGRGLTEVSYEQLRNVLIGKMGAVAASNLMGMIPSMSGVTRARLHHIATIYDGVAGWGTEFEAMFARGGMTLEDPANKVILDAAWHRSAHDAAYHMWVYGELTEATESATKGMVADSPAFKEAFGSAMKARLELIGRELIKDPDKVTVQWWQSKH